MIKCAIFDLDGTLLPMDMKEFTDTYILLLKNRLETATGNLNEYNENITAALSRIEDCDMAAEMTEFTAQNVKTQAATSILAQANQRPETILQLLQ